MSGVNSQTIAAETISCFITALSCGPLFVEIVTGCSIDRVGKYNDPIPIYPNFSENPQYNNEGYPFVTEMQDTCVYYDGSKTQEFCRACSYFQAEEDLIGTCRCPKNEKYIEGDKK